MDAQRGSLAKIVETRRAVSTELRKLIAGGSADAAAAPKVNRPGWGGAGLDEGTAPDWDRVEGAPIEELVDVIRPGGLAQQKAPRIQAALRHIRAARGDHSLEFLGDLPPLEARAWLTAIDGIGKKTASVVLLFSFGMPLMPVDRHVERVSHRIGLIPPTANADAVSAISIPNRPATGSPASIWARIRAKPHPSRMRGFLPQALRPAQGLGSGRLPRTPHFSYNPGSDAARARGASGPSAWARRAGRNDRDTHRMSAPVNVAINGFGRIGRLVLRERGDPGGLKALHLRVGVDLAACPEYLGAGASVEACGARMPHGFFNLDAEFAAGIARFVRGDRY